MRFRPAHLTATAAAVAAALLLPGPGAQAATTASLTLLKATPVTAGLKIDAKATFTSDEKLTVATDPAGDQNVPSADLTKGTITALDNKTLQFAVTMANPSPTGGAVPAVVHYFWQFTVATEDSTSSLQLSALNTRYQGSEPNGYYFGLQTCAPGPTGNTCTSAVVDGSYASGVLTWTVPMASINAAGGSEIASAGSGIYSSPGVAGVVWLASGAGLFDSMAMEPYTVPEAFVQVGVAPAGTAPGAVAMTDILPAKGSGYQATLPSAGPGSVVVGQACFGDVCGPRVTAS